MIFKDLDDLCSYARKIGKENLPITVNIRNKLTERIYKRRGTFVDKYYKDGVVFVVYPSEDTIDSFEIEWFKDGGTAILFLRKWLRILLSLLFLFSLFGYRTS